MESEEKSCDFTYECHRCKRLVSGHYQNNENDEVVMIREKSKSSIFLFECFACHYNLW